MKPDYAESIDFLRQWSSDGPWILTSIHPEQKSISTRTFLPEETAELGVWLTEQGDERNIYFSVNPATRPLDKKAERSDIESLSWLHVDIDPRPRENLKKEQERALSVLRKPVGGIPGPTVIVFSGGGYQGFWKLADPFHIGGDLEKAEEAKRWNLQLELMFGGDSCHNVDRIMRLPGTVNWPNEKKRQKGRVPTVSTLVEWFPERVYSLQEFTPAPLVQAGENGFSAKMVQVSGNIQRFGSTDELPELVSDSVKAAIVQGSDLDNPEKHPSRSEWLFWVCCELVRGGCTDDQIYAVITDPEFKISESVLNKGTMSDKYARRQIQRSREEAIHPKLRLLNEKHAVISDVGGRCKIISEVEEVIGGRRRPKITYMSFTDFSNRYCNQRIEFLSPQGNPAAIPLGKWWINHPSRSQYETIVFEPGHDIPGSYNLWKGFSFDAKPGGDCDLFLKHVFQNICSEHDVYYDYVVGWMAMSVQHPDNPGHTALVLRGRRGTGKSFFAKTFGRLFGRHFMHVSDPKHLVGSFNAHLHDCVVLFADEAFYAGDKKHEGVLKMLVTEETFTLEKKGVDATLASNYVHLIMASNEEWVVPAGFDERRFFVLDVSDASKQDISYFAAIDQQLKNGGYEELLHYLMTYDLSEFDVRKVPSTKALQDQKVLSFTSEQEWWFQKLMNGEIFDGDSWPANVFITHLAYDYTSYTRQWNMTSRGNNTRLGRFMKSCLPEGHKLRSQLSGEHGVTMEDGRIQMISRPRVYLIPSLAKCRRYWDEHFGGPYEWPEDRSMSDQPTLTEEPF